MRTATCSSRPTSGSATWSPRIAPGRSASGGADRPGDPRQAGRIARAIRVRRGGDGRDFLEVDGRPARLTTPEMLGGLGGMGMSLEELAAACLAGRYAESAPPAATDPAARLALLDHDGIARALLYPSLGLQWEAEAPDPGYALAHTRAYNRWIEEFSAGSGGRLVPIAHLSLGDPAAAARELRRAVRAGARGGFLLPFTLSGLPHGHPV